MHVSLGTYAPSATPIRSSAPMGQVPVGPTAEMGKKAKSRQSGCSMKRMGRGGTRCRCNGKLVKTSRCRR